MTLYRSHLQSIIYSGSAADREATVLRFRIRAPKGQPELTMLSFGSGNSGGAHVIPQGAGYPFA
jgi:hypothetical protein